MLKISMRKSILFMLFMFLLAYAGVALVACNKGTDYSIGLQLPVPADLRVDGGMLKWGAVDYAYGYSVRVDEEDPKIVFGVTYDLTGLTPGEYRLYVKALGNGDYIDSLEVWILYDKSCEKLKLLKPENINVGALSDGVNIDWNTVEGADKYYIRANGINIYETAVNSYKLSNLDARTYFFEVMAASDEYCDSVWSNAVIYTADLEYSYIADSNSYSVAQGAAQSLELMAIPSTYNGKLITAIAENGFKDCINLKDFYFNDTVTAIGDFAFLNCLKLEYITIPKNVFDIGFGVFNGCIALASIEVEGGNAHYCSNGGVLFNYDITVLIAYPKNGTNSCARIPDGITSIASYAFADCLRLETIVFAPTVNNIGEGALPSSLINLYILRQSSFGVITLSQNASKITNVYLPDEATASLYKNNDPWVGRAECYVVKSYAKTVSLKQNPAKNNYRFGEEFDFSEGILSVEYIDGSADEVTLNKNNAVLQTPLKYYGGYFGMQDIFFSYGGVTHLAPFVVSITNVTGLEIIKNPVKTIYDDKDLQIDLSGGVLRVLFGDGLNANQLEISMTADGITYDYNFATKAVTVYYMCAFNACQVIFYIDIAVVSNIEILVPPSKALYVDDKLGDINLSGGIAKIYTGTQDGEIINMDEFAIIGFALSSGLAYITAEFNDEEIIFSLQVIMISKIEILTAPFVIFVGEDQDGKDVNLNAEVQIIYENGATRTLVLDGTSGYTSLNAADGFVAVNYYGATLQIEVSVGKVYFIYVSKNPDNVDFTDDIGSDINLSGGEITISYSNGFERTVSMLDENITATLDVKSQKIVIFYFGRQTQISISV